jgi:hypothetical protein
MIMFRVVRSVSLAALLLSSACYWYAPHSDVELTPGTEVRFVLTAAGATALAPTLGRQTVAVEGRVTSVAIADYTLSVFATLKREEEMDGASSTSRTTWAGESVTVPRTAVAGVERRSLDTKRTVLVAALGTIASIALLHIIVHGGSGGAGSDGGTAISP